MATRPLPDRRDTFSLARDFGCEYETMRQMLEFLSYPVLESLPRWDSVLARMDALTAAVREFDVDLASKIDHHFGAAILDLMMFCVEWFPALCRTWPDSPLGFDQWTERALEVADLSAWQEARP